MDNVPADPVNPTQYDNQLPVSPDDNQNTPPDTQPAPPAPSGPESAPLGPIPEKGRVPAPEVQKPPEVAPSPEKHTPVTAPQPPVQQPAPPAQPAESSPQKDPNIVDKTEELTTLHHLEESKDPLTKEADEEEERFIEEVEKHHGRL